MNPGRILLIVIQAGNSLDRDLDHDAIAPLKVFESPILSMGSLTDVEMIFTILPLPDFSIPGTSSLVRIWEACRCLANGPSKSSIELSSNGPPGGPPELLTNISTESKSETEEEIPSKLSISNTSFS